MAADEDERGEDERGEDPAPSAVNEDSVDGFLRRVAHVSARSLGLIAAFGQPTLVSPPPLLPGADPRSEKLPVVARETYAVVAEYGRGGMGRVLVARDQRLDRRVAIKELLSSDQRAHDRFVREALITARLQHPSIVPVHEAGRWPSGEPFYAMKLVSGRPFSIVIDETRSLDDRLALLRVVIGVAEAIAYAHSQRIIHRDLKPDNILVGEFGETVVIDWGLAKHLDDAPDRHDLAFAPREAATAVTQAGSVVGTPGYMAPEQAAGHPADERSDVYALGAIIYSLLAGRPPYAGHAAEDVVRQTLAGPPPLLAERQAGVPVDLLAVVAKAMARQPGERYASARELAADLNRFSTGQLVSAHRYSRGQRLRRFVRRHRLPVVLAALGLLLSLVTGGVGLQGVVRQRDIARRERNVALAEKAAAEAARAREVARVDQLVLAQARTALERDPTLAVVLLRGLRPEAQVWPAARVVAARAQARHIAAAVRPGRVAAFAPDGSLLATGDGDGRVHLGSAGAQSGRGGEGGMVTLATGVGSARAIGFAPDGTRLAVGGSDGARLYDVAARSPLALDGDTSGDVTALAAAPDSRAFAFAGRGGVRVWDRDGRARAAPATHGGVSALFFAAGDRLVVRDGDGVMVWDGARARRLGATAGTGPLALTHDGRRVAVAGSDGVRIHNLDGAAARRVAGEEGGAVVALAFSPTDRELAVCRADGSLATLGLSDGTRTSYSRYSHAGDPCRDVLFSRDGRRLAATRGTTVRVWDLVTGELQKLRGHELEVEALVFAPDGTVLASGGLDDSVRVWRFAAALPRVLPLPGDGAPLALVGTGDSSGGVTPARGGGSVTLVRGGSDGSVELLGSDGARRRLGRHDGAVRDVAAAGGRVVSAASDGVTLHDLAGASSRTLTTLPTVRVALSGDGRVLALLGNDGAVRVQAVAAAHVQTLAPSLPVEAAPSVALSPDGTRLAAAAGNRRLVHVWDVASGAQRIVELDQDATALVFADAELLAVAESGGSLEIVYLPTGERWLLGSERARIVALTLAGGALVDLCADGRLHVWPPLPPAGATPLRAWLDQVTSAWPESAASHLGAGRVPSSD
jgi:WD40 repeat protein/tRNA A-37 threonylcarbamoyl transferase component Bud32